MRDLSANLGRSLSLTLMEELNQTKKNISLERNIYLQIQGSNPQCSTEI
jgi:hypothetical protein